MQFETYIEFGGELVDFERAARHGVEESRGGTEKSGSEEKHGHGDAVRNVLGHRLEKGVDTGAESEHEKEGGAEKMRPDLETRKG